MKLTASRLVPALALVGGIAGLFGPSSSAPAFAGSSADQTKDHVLEVRVRFGPELGKSPIDGRVLLILSKGPAKSLAYRSTTARRPSRSSGSTSQDWNPGMTL
jgi:hypothetical protein